MDDKKNMTSSDLDKVLSDMAMQPKDVSTDLLAKVMADAQSVLDASSEPAAAPATAPGFLANLFASMGGFPATASLASVALVGVWLGFSPPSLIDDLTSDYLVGAGAYDMGDLMPAIDGYLDEG